jgi:hypothetical protein
VPVSRRLLSGVTFIVAAMPAIDPRERVERFVLRARKVNAHSLVREHRKLMEELTSGTIRVRVQVNMRTGEAEHRVLLELPPEELFESFAARIRPFIMRKEAVYWEVVLDALEKLASPETLAQVVDIPDLRSLWEGIITGSTVAQAFYMVTDHGTMSDFKLAERWLYTDLLHAQSADGDFTLNQRYQAAAGVYARLGACVNNTLNVIGTLAEQGLISIDLEVFTEPVLAETSIEMPGRVYSAPLGAELPSDLSNLDPNVWHQIHEDIELAGPEDNPPEEPEV